MASKTDEIIYLNNEEFIMMVSVAGKNKWFGIYEHNNDINLKKEDLYRIAISLYQKELVEVIDNKIFFIQPYSELVKAIPSMNKCLVLSKAKVNGSMILLYVPEKRFDFYLAVFKSENDLNKVGLQIINKEDLARWLKDEDVFPFSVIDYTDKVAPETVIDDIRLYSEITFYDNPSGIQNDTIKIFDMGLYGIVQIMSSEKEIKTCTYCDDDSIKLIMDKISN